MWRRKSTPFPSVPVGAFALASAFACLTLSCASNSDSGERRPATQPTQPSSQPPTPSPPLSATPDAAAAPAASGGPVPANSKQLIVTLTEDWQGTDAAFHRFERKSGGDWQPVGKAFDSVVGRTGLAWGRGLHTLAAAEGEPTKVEGDGKSPAGVFAVGALWGYDKSFSGRTQLEYQQIDKSWRCVNDSKSQHYNRVFDSKGVKKDWDEAEEMRRRDRLYELVVAIDHNAIFEGEPTPEGGSCIFFHVWRRAGAPTIGCTAMPLAQMKMLAGWLDPKKTPVLVALPQARYQELQARWQLPAL